MYKVIIGGFHKEFKVQFDKESDALAFAYAMEKANGFWGIEILEFVEKQGFTKSIYESKIPA